MQSQPTRRFHGVHPSHRRSQELARRRPSRHLRRRNTATSSAWPTSSASTDFPTASAAALNPAATISTTKSATSPATIARTVVSYASHRQTASMLPDHNLVIFGRRISPTMPTSRPAPYAAAKSKTAAFVSDFRDLAVGDYVVHVEHGIAQYLRPAGDRSRTTRHRSSS